VEESADFIDIETVKKSWIETKQRYISDKGAFNRKTLLTYRRSWKQRYFLNNHLANLRNEGWPQSKNIKEELLQELQVQGERPKAFYKQKC
jgi:hypothetical protein